MFAREGKFCILFREEEMILEVVQGVEASSLRPSPLQRLENTPQSPTPHPRYWAAAKQMHPPKTAGNFPFYPAAGRPTPEERASADLLRHYPAASDHARRGIAPAEVGRPVARLMCKAVNLQSPLLGEGESDALTAYKENIYQSNKTKPLGKGANRGHILPTATQAPEFRFGSAPAASDASVKELMRWETGWVDEFGSALTKEARRRALAGNSFQPCPAPPSTTQFSLGVRDCLQTQPFLVVTSPRVEDFKAVTSPPLGKRRGPALQPRELPPPAPQTLSSQNVKDCLTSLERPQVPRRAPSLPAQAGGLATTALGRRDMGLASKLEQLSLATDGDEALLRLELLPRTRAEVAEILAAAGIGYCAGKFEAVWQKALALECAARGNSVAVTTASMRAVLVALRELDGRG